MERQLILLDDSELLKDRVDESDVRDWRLDERTREVGREGLALARAALRDSVRRSAAA